MAFVDDLARATSRLQVNLPQAAIGGSSSIYNLLSAFMSSKADTDFLIAQSSLNMFLTTATGAALDTKASDYGVSRNLGIPATVTLVFSTQANAVTTINIPAGVFVSTPGDGVTTIAQAFVTQVATTIAAGTNTSAPVPANCTVSGIIGNVATGSVTVVVTPLGPINYTVTNTALATPGTDPDTDAVLRNKVLAQLLPKYGTNAISSAILAAGAYDAYVATSAGAITYYYSDILGGQPAALTTAVAAAVVASSPANLATTPAAFTVTNYTAAGSIVVTFTAPIAFQGGAYLANVQLAVMAYIQGLTHGQTPNTYGISNYVQSAVGYLINFNCSTAFTTATNTALYRATGVASTVVSATATWV